jgi:hypothetical protein
LVEDIERAESRLHDGGRLQRNPHLEPASAISSETIATRPPAGESSSSRNALPAAGGNSSIEKKLPVTASTGNRSSRPR